MNETRRQRRVASLIKEKLSPILMGLIQDSYSVLITIVKVDMSKDLKTAFVYLSIYGERHENKIFDVLDEKKGYLRKSIALKTKLKYNPQLIFLPDLSIEYEEKIDKLIKKTKKNEK